MARLIGGLENRTSFEQELLLKNQRKLEKEVARYVAKVEKQISLLEKLQRKFFKK
jgi:hypothetical protein